MRFKEFNITEAVDNDVMALQRELKAAGENLGTFGPKTDGIDGRLGPYTRRAAANKPEIAAKYKDVLTRPDAFDAQKVDISAIQNPDFKAKLEKIAKLLGTTPNAMLAVMKQESGVNPAAQNKQGGASGLIQFMPATARMLGTTTDELRKMDAVQQLDYVYKYYKYTGVGDGSVGDLYMATFMPKYIGYPDNHVLGSEGDSGFSGAVYRQNKGLDRNHDGKITVGDVKQSVSRFV